MSGPKSVVWRYFVNKDFLILYPYDWVVKDEGNQSSDEELENSAREDQKYKPTKTLAKRVVDFYFQNQVVSINVMIVCENIPISFNDYYDMCKFQLEKSNALNATRQERKLSSIDAKQFNYIISDSHIVKRFTVASEQVWSIVCETKNAQKFHPLSVFERMMNSFRFLSSTLPNAEEETEPINASLDLSSIYLFENFEENILLGFPQFLSFSQKNKYFEVFDERQGKTNVKSKFTIQLLSDSSWKVLTLRECEQQILRNLTVEFGAKVLLSSCEFAFSSGKEGGLEFICTGNFLPNVDGPCRRVSRIAVHNEKLFTWYFTAPDDTFASGWNEFGANLMTGVHFT